MNRIVLPCIYLWIASALAIFNSRTGTTMTSPFGHLRKYAAIGLLAYAASWSTLASAQSPPTTVAYSIAAVFYSDCPASDAQWRGPVFTTGTVPTHITEITFGLTNTAPTAQAKPRRAFFNLTTATSAPTAIPLRNGAASPASHYWPMESMR